MSDLEETRASTFASLASLARMPARRLLGLLTLLALTAAACLGLRLAWHHSHPRVGLTIADDLTLVSSPLFRLDLYGGDVSLRIRSVDGQPIGDLADLRRLADTRCVRFGVESADSDPPVHELVWAEMRTFDELEVEPRARVAGLPGCAALRDGERLAAINAEMIGEDHVLGARLAAAVRRSSRLGLRLRDARSDRLILMRAVDWPSAWAIFVTGALFVGLGLGTFALKPHAASARGFLVFCLAVALFSCLRAVPHPYRSDVERQLFYFAQASIPLASGVFIATFTVLRRALSLRAVAATLAGSTLAALAMNFWLWPGDARRGVLSPWLLAGWAGILLLLVAGGATADLVLRLFGRNVDTLDRSHGTTLRWAILGGFAPLTLYTLFAGWAGLGTWRAPFEISVIAFPLVVGYSILGRNLLGLNELVSDGLRRSAVVAVLALAAAVVIGLAGPLSERLLPELPWWVRTASIAVVALLAAWVYAGMRRRLDRGRIKPDASHLEMLTALEEQRSRNVGVSEQSRHLVEQARSLGRAQQAGLLLRRPGTDDWILAAAHGLTRGPQREKCDDLLAAMEQERRPLFRDEMVDGGAVASGRLVASMDSLSADIALPLVARDRLVGILSLGASAEPALTAAELRRLRDLASFGAVDLAAAIDDLRRPLVRIAALYPELPAKIGAWSVERALGRGGMACVYLASCRGVAAAIKVPTVDVQADEKLRERFFRESSAMLKVKHPNVVQVLDVGRQGDEPFTAVEFCPGGTLRERIEASGPMSENDVRSVLAALARGLGAAHTAGVLHRDIKPDNIFFGGNGEPKVGDFGLARLLEESTITSTGAFLGTPAYVAPEIILGKEAVCQSDQYSLALCGMEMLLGRRLIEGGGAAALMRHLRGDLPALGESRPDLDPALAALLHRATARRPEDRFASWDAFAAGLSAT